MPGGTVRGRTRLTDRRVSAIILSMSNQPPALAGQGESPMDISTVKEEARKLIEALPDNSTWDDLMHDIYVRQSIEAGLADSQAGRVTSVEQVRKNFGLPQ